MALFILLYVTHKRREKNLKKSTTFKSCTFLSCTRSFGSSIVLFTQSAFANTKRTNNRAVLFHFWTYRVKRYLLNYSRKFLSLIAKLYSYCKKTNICFFHGCKICHAIREIFHEAACDILWTFLFIFYLCILN